MKILISNKKQIECLLQENPPQIKRYKKDKMFYIISVIYNSFNKNEETVHEMPLSTVLLKELIGNYYKMYIDYLIKNRIIMRTSGYMVQNCMKYILYPDFNKEPEWYTITDFPLSAKLKKHQKSLDLKFKRKLPYLKKWYNLLKLDQEEGRRFIQDVYKLKDENPELRDISEKNYGGIKDHKKQLTYSERIIELFKESKFDANIDNKGYRLHNILTKCGKELRNFIKCKDQSLVSLDLKNSQPYLLLIFFNENFLNSDIFYLLRKGTKINNQYVYSIMFPLSSRTQCGKEFQRYKNLVQEGLIYDDLSDKIELLITNKNDRKRVAKKRILITFYSDRGTKSGGMKTIFSKEFPMIYKFLNSLKTMDYRNVSILLQRIESFLILDVICGRIAMERPELPIYTIHDCIVTTVGNEDYVKSVMLEEMESYVGVAPNVSIEYWKPEHAWEKVAEMQSIIKQQAA